MDLKTHQIAGCLDIRRELLLDRQGRRLFFALLLLLLLLVFSLLLAAVVVVVAICGHRRKHSPRPTLAVASTKAR